MKDPKDITFIRLDVLENWRFWNEYRDNPEAAGKEVIAEADALLTQDMTKNERAARLMAESIEFRKKKQAAGQAGGLAKSKNQQKNSQDSPNSLPPTTGRPPGNQRGAAAKRPLRNRGPTSKLEFETFIYEPSNNINTALAWEWYDIHSARDWTDSGGNPLNNWKGALINYCKSKQENKK